LPAKASLLRLFCDASQLRPDFTRPRPQIGGPVTDALFVQSEFVESMESGWIWVPNGFAGLSIEQQQRWTLSVIHEAAGQLTRLRGGDPDVLDLARQHVEAQAMRFVWAGSWKTSPDRRHQARLVVTINNDGMGRARLEAATRSGVVLAHCDGKAASSNGADLVRLTKTVRWHGSNVATANAVMDPYGPRQGYVQIRVNEHDPK
jgi:hypothetical protein